MKIRFGDRLLIAVSGMLLLLLSVASLLVLFGVLKLGGVIDVFVSTLPFWGKLIGTFVLLLIGAIGVHGIMVLFHRSRERKFVSQENENGNVSISINALEIMARKCVENCKDIKTKRVEVSREGEGVAVNVSVLVPSGINIPQLISALQMQIRKYVSSCSGIPVESVSVQVETDPSQKGYVPALMAPKVTEQNDNAIVIENKPPEASVEPFEQSAPEEQTEPATVAQEESALEDGLESELPIASEENLPE